MMILVLTLCLATQIVAPRLADANKMPHCGVAAVYACSTLLGIKTNPDEIRKSIEDAHPGADLSALSLTQICEAFELLGLHAVPKQCDPAHSIYLRTPFVAYYLPRRIRSSEDRAGHVVVVTKVSATNLKVLDLTESAEPINVSLADFCDTWDGHFLEVTPYDAASRTLFERPATWVTLAILSLALFAYSLRTGIGRRTQSQLEFSGNTP